MKQCEIILVPGLGDAKLVSAWFYRYIAKRWQKQGYAVQIHMVQWRKQDGASKKLELLVREIDTVHHKGREVVLVGVSAGASLALLGYAARPHIVKKVIAVCGWVNADHHGFTHLTTPNMTCREVLLRWGVERDQLSKQQLQHVLAFRPLLDETVYAHMAHMKGLKNKRVFSIGHVPSIVWILLARHRTMRAFIDKE